MHSGRAVTSALQSSSVAKCCAPARMSASGKLRHSIESLRERQLWAGHVYHATVRPRLCKVHYLRIAPIPLRHQPHGPRTCRHKIRIAFRNLNLRLGGVGAGAGGQAFAPDSAEGALSRGNRPHHKEIVPKVYGQKRNVMFRLSQTCFTNGPLKMWGEM